MPQKTRKEKILAEKRREHQLLISKSSPTYSLNIKSGSQIPTSLASPTVQNVQTMNVIMGHADLKKDLLKISLFTVGAVAFQLFLHFAVIH